MSDVTEDTVEGADTPAPEDSLSGFSAPTHDAPPPVDTVDSPDKLENETFMEKVEGKAEAIIGWPKTFFHPVHGKREFKDPNEHAQVTQGNSDWRFTSASAADAARTDAEAQLVILNNHQQLLDAHKANGPVVRNSVAAEENRDAGNFEPQLN